MSRHLSSRFSPLRDKRRQSDAKWRASVATCYDALKYIVPNMKHMSKKKISKALILQESEKHIQDLEDAISNLLNVECKERGQVALWREGDHWSQCSVDKLRADFSEKQQRVFHIPSHGRRCYNLLQDIKEEVFNMKADSKQMVFVREENINIIDATELTGDGTCDASAVSKYQYPIANMSEITQAEGSSQTRVNLTASDKQDYLYMKVQCVPEVPDNCAANESTMQARKQPHQSWIVLNGAENMFKATPIRGLNEDKKKTCTTRSLPSFKPVYLLSADSSKEEESAATHCKVSAGSSLPAASSATPLAGSNLSRKNSSTDSLLSESSDKNHFRLEKFDENIYILSNKRDYTCLLNALEADKEQEVPSLETPHTTTRIKWPRLTSSEDDSLVSYRFVGNSSSSKITDSFFSVGSDKANNIVSQTYVFCNAESNISNIPSSTASYNSISQQNVADITVKVEESSSYASYDPLLSSLNTPKHELDMPFFCWTEGDGVIKQQLTQGSARKRLNFNCPPHLKWPQTSSCFVSPDRLVPTSPSLAGFTPIKLPDDLTLYSNQDNALESFISPWKTLNSPFNSENVPQDYIDSPVVNSLLCLETIDAKGLSDAMGSEITPAQPHNAYKTHQPEELQKVKISSALSDPESKLKPKCRRKLERFYDHLAPDVTSLTDESHVVPQINISFRSSPQLHGHNNFYSVAIDDDASLLCLETIDSLE